MTVCFQIIKMIIYFYLFIPLVFRLAESSSIKGRNEKNELVPFLSSKLDLEKKDNSLKIVSNEPFIIEFQMPSQKSGKVEEGVTLRDKKAKRQNKKRVSKGKSLRKKIRRKRDLSEVEDKENKPHHLKKPQTEEKGNHNKTQNSIGRLEILKALHSHAMKTELKKLKPEGLKKTPTSRNLHRNHLTADLQGKTTYPNTPKTEPHNYSYKDLVADRERLEQKINYIKNMLHVNDTKTDDAGRVRRRSELDKTPNKLARMFLTLSTANRLRDKRKPKCHHDDAQDIWEKERRKSGTRQSSSSNEQRYKVKKWIEYMKNKRSSGRTCTCMENEYNEDGDVFPLEQKLSKGYQLSDVGSSSEESSENFSYGTLGKSGRNRNRDDARSKFRTVGNGGRRKYELPLDDLEVYRTRAKQILQNAEEILDKIKEEEERRLSSPTALVSHLKELTSRIQGDPRNNENDLIKIIQKNLGWKPESKSESDTDGNTFVENVKTLLLDPYEKAKALTDENTRKISTYLLRNLGKIGSEEEGEEEEETTGRSDQSSQVYHAQIPQTEEMFSANLAKEDSEVPAKGREELQKWSDTLSAMLGGKDEDTRPETAEGETKQNKQQEDMLRRRMEAMIKEQGKKISEYTEKPEAGRNDEGRNDEGRSDEGRNDEGRNDEGITAIDLMTGENIETPKERKAEDGEILESPKQEENKEKSDVSVGNVPEGDTVAKESETEMDGSVTDAKDQERVEEQKPEDLAESVRENVDENEEDKVRVELPLETEEVKAVAGENTPKEDETKPEEVESAADKVLETKSDVNEKEALESVVLSPAEELEKKASEESTDEAVKSSQEAQEVDTLQAKEERDENDVINSKYLVAESPERSSDDEVKEFAEDVEKLIEEDRKEKSEETARQEKTEDNEETVMKEDSSETKGREDEGVGSESVALEKETEMGLEETQDAVSESKETISEVIEASQDPKESLEFDSLKKDNSEEKEGESIVESEMSENTQRVTENEKKEDSAEEAVEKTETSFETEKDTADDTVEKSKSVEEETEREDDTLKLSLEGEDGKEEGERVREESGTEDENQEREISRENVDERDHGDQEETLKSSLDDSDKEEKSEEIIQKSAEEREGNMDDQIEEREDNTDEKMEERENNADEKVEERENNADEKVEERKDNSDEKVEEREDSTEEKVEEREDSTEEKVEEREDNTDEKVEEREGSTDEKVEEQEDNTDEKMEEREDSTDEKVEESPLRSENTENETVEEEDREISEKATEQNQEESEEVAMKSEEVSAAESTGDDTRDKEVLKVTEKNSEIEDEPQLRAEQPQEEEAEEEGGESALRSENSEDQSNETVMEAKKSEEKDEAVEMEKGEENEGETLKATADEENETTEEAASPEDEKVEKELENLEEISKEADAKEEDSVDVNKEPKLVMTIREGLGEEDFKKDSVEEEKGGDGTVEDMWSKAEEESEDDTQSMDVKGESVLREASPEEQSADEFSVQGENFEDMDNEIDSDDQKLRRANKDATLTGMNSSEEENLSGSDVVEGGDQVKEMEGANLGRKENVASSQQSQNVGPNLSRSALKVPKSIGKIMRDLDGKEKEDFSLTNLNPEKIDHFIDKIDEAELQNKLESEDVDCRKECACADEMDTRSRNIGRYEIVKDFLHWAKDLQLNRVLTDN